MNRKIIITQSDAEIASAFANIVASLGNEARLTATADKVNGNGYHFVICHVSGALTEDDQGLALGHTDALYLGKSRKEKDVKGFVNKLKDFMSPEYQRVIGGTSKAAVDAVYALLNAGCTVRQRQHCKVTELSTRYENIPCWDVCVPRR